jgi:tetratricopeptide (TPR) repeat protein
MVLVPALAWSVLQGSAAYAASSAYATNSTLWKTAVARTPGSARATALRGLHLLADAGDRVRTEPALSARIETFCEAGHHHDPLYELPEVCFGRLRVAQKRWPEAALHFERALALSPDRNDRIMASLVELGPDLSEEATEKAQERLVGALDAYPFSPELHAAGARLHHKLGHPERAMGLYRRARSLRPERWETVVAALELALDLGDAPSAQRTWLEEQKLLAKADPTIRVALARRMAAARQREDLSLLQSLFSPGVF